VIKEALRGALSPADISAFGLGYPILGVSLVLESVAFLCLLREVRVQARAADSSVGAYVHSTTEPASATELVDNGIGRVGGVLATVALALTQPTGSRWPMRLRPTRGNSGSSRAPKNGQVIRTLPDEQSAGSVVAALLPAGTHYVKAFGTLGADALASAAHGQPHPAVLFYATDDDVAAAAAEQLISAAGFEPLKAGRVADALRLEVPGGDLHQNGGLNGRLLDLDQARAAVEATEVTA
jgi:hypothetical protein